VAKAYAMTGWRIGWTISTAPLTKAMTAFQSHTTFNPSSVSQAAALAALTLGDPVERAVEAMVAEFRVRRDAALAILHTEPRLRANPPEGAFYLWMEAPGAGRVPDAGAAFATRLLEQHDVAVVAGSAFMVPDWFRVSYATDRAQVETAMHRIVEAFRAS
jgi:aspartate aminotransferase